MGILAKRIDHIDIVRQTIRLVFEHFDKITIDRSVVQKILLAADLAFSDKLLFEKFIMWEKERDDEVFIFHINRFFEKHSRSSISEEERNITSQRESVEATIKEGVRSRQKQIFGQRITKLAMERNLLTNKQLGDFLEISDEQARKFRIGENKPQLATLKKVADKFDVSIEYLIGLSKEPRR